MNCITFEQLNLDDTKVRRTHVNNPTDCGRALSKHSHMVPVIPILLILRLQVSQFDDILVQTRDERLECLVVRFLTGPSSLDYTRRCNPDAFGQLRLHIGM